MAQKRSASNKKIVKVHWLWVILAVIALAIPLTVFLSGEQQNSKSNAAEASERVAVIKKPTSCKSGVLSVNSGPKCGKKNDKRTRSVTVTCRNGAVMTLTGKTGNDTRDCRTIGVWTARAQTRCAQQTTYCKSHPTITPKPSTALNANSSYGKVTMTCNPSQKEFIGKSTPLAVNILANGKPLQDIRITYKFSKDNSLSPVNVITNSNGIAIATYKLGEDIIAGNDVVTAYATTSTGKVFASCTYNLKFRAEALKK